MRNRTRMIAAAAAVSAALAAGSTAAVASATGAKPGAPAKTVSASEKPGHDAMVAAVAGELHVSTTRVSAALEPLFAAGHADTSSLTVRGRCPFARRQHRAAERCARPRQAEPGRGPARRAGPGWRQEGRSGRLRGRRRTAGPRRDRGGGGRGAARQHGPGQRGAPSRCSRRAMPTRRRRPSRRLPVRSASAPSSYPPRSCTPSRAWPQGS